LIYEEPERTRDLIAEYVFGKNFDELSDEEKEAVHELAVELRKKEQLKGSI
jgi:hypothetical protein